MDSLRSVMPNAMLERPEYHLLSNRELRLRGDEPEALYALGYNLLYGMDVVRNEQAGWDLIHQAARLGHPIALATCLRDGKGGEQDIPRAFQLFAESAARGHPSGNHH